MSIHEQMTVSLFSYPTREEVQIIEHDLDVLLLIDVRLYAEDGTLKAEPLSYKALDARTGKLIYRGTYQPFVGIDPLWAVVQRAVANNPDYDAAALAERFRTEDQWSEERAKIYAEQDGNVYHLRRTVL